MKLAIQPNSSLPGSHSTLPLFVLGMFVTIDINPLSPSNDHTRFTAPLYRRNYFKPTRITWNYRYAGFRGCLPKYTTYEAGSPTRPHHLGPDDMWKQICLQMSSRFFHLTWIVSVKGLKTFTVNAKFLDEERDDIQATNM
jgi:hypothetical protein